MAQAEQARRRTSLPTLSNCENKTMASRIASAGREDEPFRLERPGRAPIRSRNIEIASQRPRAQGRPITASRPSKAKTTRFKAKNVVARQVRKQRRPLTEAASSFAARPVKARRVPPSYSAAIAGVSCTTAT